MAQKQSDSSLKTRCGGNLDNFHVTKNRFSASLLEAVKKAVKACLVFFG